jgi:peptidyl-prolyl cis-trans isomerase D
MLQNIRNWVTGWLAVVIVVLLIIPFAFWGINYYFGQGSDILAATVNGSKITLRDYQLAYQRLRQQWQSAGTDLANQEEVLKQRTIDTLINRMLLSQLKGDMDLSVGNSQVRQTIMSIRAFQGDNGFDRSLYEQYLNSAGYTPVTFEAQLREDMTSEQLQAGIIESGFVTKAAVERIARLNNQTRDFNYALIPFDKIAENIQISDAEVKEYYDNNDKEFMDPEKVRIAYLDLSRDSIAKQVTVNEDELMSYFENHKENYSVAEQRKVDQVLVSAGKKPSEKLLAEAKTRAEEIKKELESGKTIKDIANESSSAKDKDINVDVSEFGYLAKGILEPEVDSLAFSLKKGEVGGPVHTDSGYHIILIEDIRGGQKSTFDEVRDQVEKDYRNSEAEKRFYDLAEKLATMTFEHPESLEVASEELGLPIQKSEYFSRDGIDKDFFKNPKVLSAAFSDEVLQNGNNSDVIELDSNRDIVLHVIDHRMPQKKPLSEVHDDIVKTLRFNKGSHRTGEIGEDIIKGLEQGGSKATLAAKYSIDWKTASNVKRDDVNVNRAVLRKAFGMGHPGGGKPLVGGTSLGSGDYVVIVLNAVHDAGTLAYEDLNPVRKELERLQAATGWIEFMDSLKNHAKVHIYRDNL